MFKFSEMSWEFIRNFMKKRGGKDMDMFDRRYIEDFLSTWQDYDGFDRLSDNDQRTQIAEKMVFEAESKLVELKNVLEQMFIKLDDICMMSDLGENEKYFKDLQIDIKSIIDEKF